MAQRPADLTPLASTRHFLGAELRRWRQRAGLSLAQLARAVYAHPDLLAKVEKAQRWPSSNLVEQCDAVLGTGGILSRLHELAASEQGESGTRRGSAGRTTVPSWPIIVVIPVADLGPLRRDVADDDGDATLAEMDHGERVSGTVVNLDLARARRTGPVPDVAVAPKR
jgi:transcriptional regulator with XRE-family HTH domain